LSDPEHDRPAELEKYASERGADAAGWLFLIGMPAQIDQVLALYRLKRMRNPDGTVNHSAASFLPSGAPVPAAGGQGLHRRDGYRTNAWPALAERARNAA
jgi:cytochrome oxidase Cu insertion factor (SCO1/SenC/PrrC family)